MKREQNNCWFTLIELDYFFNDPWSELKRLLVDKYMYSVFSGIWNFLKSLCIVLFDVLFLN